MENSDRNLAIFNLLKRGLDWNRGRLRTGFRGPNLRMRLHTPHSFTSAALETRNRLERELIYVNGYYWNRGFAYIQKVEYSGPISIESEIELLGTNLPSPKGFLTGVRVGFDFIGGIKKGKHMKFCVIEAKASSKKQELNIYHKWPEWRKKDPPGIRVHQLNEMFALEELGALALFVWMTGEMMFTFRPSDVIGKSLVTVASPFLKAVSRKTKVGLFDYLNLL